MPNTCRCKKCGLEAPVGPACPRCGGKLNPKDAHTSWRMERNPVCDWMCWNAVMRVLLPALMLALALVLLLEALLGGMAGVEDLLRKGLLLTFALVLLAASALTLLRMLLMGEDVLECVLDGKGVTVRTLLPHPTAVKLLCRMRSPALLRGKPHGSWWWMRSPCRGRMSAGCSCGRSAPWCCCTRRAGGCGPMCPATRLLMRRRWP